MCHKRMEGMEAEEEVIYFLNLSLLILQAYVNSNEGNEPLSQKFLSSPLTSYNDDFHFLRGTEMI